MKVYRGKSEYLGAWSYVFLEILYCIPLLGLICAIIHSFSDKNTNRKHFARSFFARLLLVIIVAAVIVLILYLSLGHDAFMKVIQEYQALMQQSTPVIR